MSRRLLGAGAVAAIALAVGCKTSPPRSHTWVSPSAAAHDAALGSAASLDLRNAPAEAAAPAAGQASADALARKAEAYSKEIAPLLARRAGSNGPAASAGPAPSQVQWLDPTEFRLGSAQTSGQPDTDGRAVVRPIIDAAPLSANQAEPAAPSAGDAPRPPARGDDGPKANAAVALSAPGPALPVPALRPPAPAADVLSEKLSRRIKDYPRDVSAHLEYQLLQFLLDEPTPQLSVLSSLPPEDRELVTAVLDGLANFRNALRADNNMLLSKKIKPLLDMAERLRSQADLTVSTIALCTRVNGFGSYEPIDPPRFSAGKDHPVIVYCEVANFASNLNDKQLWETRLTWDMTLYTEQGMSVWSDRTETIADTSRIRRHDFFVRKMITLPGALTIGRYLLKVSIVDTQSNRVAEATAPIVIAAQ